MSTMHEIDYEIFGDEMQYVEITLDPGETVIAEAGGMMYMTPASRWRPSSATPRPSRPGLPGRPDGAGKRLLTGESLFMTMFHNEGARQAQGRLRRALPGQDHADAPRQLGGELICQKDSFLCAAKGVPIGIAVQEADRRRPVRRRGLHHAAAAGRRLRLRPRRRHDRRARRSAPGETLRLDTGCLVAFQPSRALRHPDGRRHQDRAVRRRGPVLRDAAGPGRVWLQSLPFCRLAGRILAAAPQAAAAAARKARSWAASATCSTGTATRADRPDEPSISCAATPHDLPDRYLHLGDQILGPIGEKGCGQRQRVRVSRGELEIDFAQWPEGSSRRDWSHGATASRLLGHCAKSEGVSPRDAQTRLALPEAFSPIGPRMGSPSDRFRACLREESRRTIGTARRGDPL